MQQPHRKNKYLPKKAILVVAVFVTVTAIVTSGFKAKDDYKEEYKAGKDSVASIAAFADVYKVLMHPRCMNCHPAGDIPLQNDDSHIHTMNPKRAKDGHGLYAMKCTNCHQPANAPAYAPHLATPSGPCHQPI